MLQQKNAGAFNGQSAYQIAVQSGFNGTEDQWLNSLRYDHSEEFQKIADQIYADKEAAALSAATSEDNSNCAAASAELAQKAQSEAALSEENSQTYSKQAMERQKAAEISAINSASNAKQAQVVLKEVELQKNQVQAFALDAKENAGLASFHASNAAATMSLSANALQRTIKNEVICVDDVSPIDHFITCRIYSKNILSYPYVTKASVINGVEFIVNSDGSITVNGTATSDSSFTLSHFSDLSSRYTTSPLYMSGIPFNITTIESGNFCLKLSNESTGLSYEDCGNGMLLPPLDFKHENGKIEIWVASGTHIDNITVMPQIEAGTTASSFTPPISQLNHVTITRTNANIFGSDQMAQSLLSIFEGRQDDDGSILFQAEKCGGKKLFSFPFKKGKQYTFFLYGKNELPNQTALNLYIKYDDGTGSGLDGVPNQNSLTVFHSLIGKNVIGLYGMGYIGTTRLYTDKCGIIEGVVNEADFVKSNYQHYSPVDNGDVPNINSCSPIMNIYSDTPGTVLEVIYNQDIGKFLNLILQRISALENHLTE